MDSTCLKILSKLRMETGEQLPDPFILTSGWSSNATFLPEL